jgi:hypothetical protein
MNADFLRALADQEGEQALQPHGREEQSPSAKPLETTASSRSRARLSASALSNIRILNASAESTKNPQQ